ncbi:MAG: hypothetical protein D4R92_02695 [Actinobacteria bacterium]|nr:MAG: hypothetical protein D4R92_02695 [Actinomycetota bacterium]
MLAVIARLWMRWISTDPEFSWAGTIGIVVGFSVFFTAHATVLFGIRKAWSRLWLTVTRIGAVIFSFGIFGAAGATMLPTVVTTSLATRRTDWPRPVRLLLFMLGLIIPIKIARDIGSDFGWGITTAGRIILFVLIYCVVVAAARVTASPQADSWRMNSVLRAILWFLVAGVAIIVAISVALNG